MSRGLDVQIGINPIGWSNDDLPSLGGETTLETALAEGKAIGYEGFELGNKFPRESKALAEVLGRHGLSLVSGWYSGRLARQTVAKEMVAVGPHVKLLADNGARVMVYGEVEDSIQGAAVPLHQRPRFFRAGQWSEYGDKLTTFGRHLLSHGVRLAYHHHMGAYVETEGDIDQLVANSGEEVGLLFDSGHLAFSGADPVRALRKHVARVCHVHCKDVRPYVIRLARNRNWSFVESVLNGAFTVPGDGALDFGELLAVLQAHGYRGWLVVEAEQDPVIAPSYIYADKGYRHLRALVERLPREGATA